MKRPTERQLQDLVSVGPATVRDLNRLGVTSVAELALCDPQRLYEMLCRKTGKRQDPCVLDVYRAAVSQARNPRLPIEQCVWWYWSRQRKDGTIASFEPRHSLSRTRSAARPAAPVRA